MCCSSSWRIVHWPRKNSINFQKKVKYFTHKENTPSFPTDYDGTECGCRVDTLETSRLFVRYFSISHVSVYFFNTLLNFFNKSKLLIYLAVVKCLKIRMDVSFLHIRSNQSTSWFCWTLNLVSASFLSIEHLVPKYVTTAFLPHKMGPNVGTSQTPCKILISEHWELMTSSYSQSFITFLNHCSRGAMGKSFCSWVTWPDLVIWSCMTLDQNFHKSCGKHGGKVGENPAALAPQYFRYPLKTWGGVQTPSPQQGAD